MIKYFGTPITPKAVFIEYMCDKNVMISYCRRDDFKRAVRYCRSIMIDNGAFSYYRKGVTPDWSKFYEWVESVFDLINYFIIPDVIDGSEGENNKLIINCPHKLWSKAIPVYHLHESIDRLRIMIDSFEYIAFGSSGKYWQIGSYNWHKRMDELMRVVCDSSGKPKVKIHMLRCLNKNIYCHYPFYSGDSTGFAQNHSRYGPENILKNILPYNSPDRYCFKPYQLDIFDILGQEDEQSKVYRYMGK